MRNSKAYLTSSVLYDQDCQPLAALDHPWTEHDFVDPDCEERPYGTCLSGWDD